MGVVLLMGDGTLLGGHFTQAATEGALLRAMRRAVIVNGSGMSELYCIADIAEHVGRHGGKELAGKAEGLGFSGHGFTVDLGVMRPTEGSYAQVISNGAGNRATIRCALNQHVHYAHGPGGAAGVLIRGAKISGHGWNASYSLQHDYAGRSDDTGSRVTDSVFEALNHRLKSVQSRGDHVHCQNRRLTES